MPFITGREFFDFRPLWDGAVMLEHGMAYLDETLDEIFVVPAGFVCDLASYPRLARPFFDRLGDSMRPAVLHDYLYVEQPVSKRHADRIFREALKEEGTGFWGRWASWAGVAVGGWWAWLT